MSNSCPTPSEARAPKWTESGLLRRASLLFVLLLLGSWNSRAGMAQYSYSYFKESRPLQLDGSRLAVHRKPIGNLRSAGRIPAGLEAATVETPPIPGWILAESTTPTTSSPELERALSRLLADPTVTFVSPVFLGEDGGPVVVTPTLLVGFLPSVDPESARAQLSEHVTGTVVEEDWGGMPRTFRVESSSRNGLRVLEQANRLARLPEVSFAEPDMIFTGRGALLPNDPGFSNCWGLHNTGQSGGTPDRDLDGPEAWNLTTGDPSIVVVVLDDGVQQDHPDLNQVSGTDSTSQGPGDGSPLSSCDNHGTAVAGCVSASIDNNRGTVGIAPGCRSASARTFIPITNPCTGSWTSQASWTVASLTFAENIGARVTCNSNVYGFTSSSIASKYNQTRTAGIVHFACAGNDGGTNIAYPGSLTSVNAVTAVDRNGGLAGFATTGVGLAFVAPGVSVYTTDRTGSSGYSGGDYTFIDGCSFATPYAAGVAALVLSLYPTLTAAEVETFLRDSAVDLGPAGYDTSFGWGFLNAHRALTAPLVPSLDDVAPREGQLRGGYSITLTGRDFSPAATVTVGAEAAEILERNGTTEIVVRTPEGVRENSPVDVTVCQIGGSSTIASALNYLPNDPALELANGFPSIGSQIVLELFGEAQENCALLADAALGSCTRGGIPLELACTPKFRVIHNSFAGFGGSDLSLGDLGRRPISFAIPNRTNLIFRNVYFQGIVRNTGTILPTETITLTIFP